jgi:sodium transport system permease protein
MMRIIWTVFRKEVLENVRDRRTLFSAFLFVPLIGPLLFAFMTAFIVDRAVGEADESLRLPVVGAEYAPNLMQFATENGANVVRLTATVSEAKELVRNRRELFVLIISSDIGAELQAGDPAVIELVSDSSDNKAQRFVGRARGLVGAFGGKIGGLRLLARGVDPSVIEPFDVRHIDVATPSGRALLLLGTVTYFLLFSLLMGGLYLAIDVTAGERERGSLESLLCQPIRRSSIVLGKIAATALFMVLALIVTLTALVICMQFLPLEKLGMSSNLGPMIGVKIAAVMLPMSLFGAALLFTVGSFTRSYREAQTWLGLVLAIPTLPILFASMANVRASTEFMLIPSLSQHLIATNFLRGDPVEPVHIAVSAISTLLLGALLTIVATQLYRRERLLG